MLFTPNNSEQRSPPPYYRGCWHGVSRGFLWRYRQLSGVFDRSISSLLTELYNPKAFIAHAALLRQGFPHCAIFPTAASRRSLDRVSVPVWPITLSGRLTIVALVGHDPTNKLMVREPIPRRQLPRRGHLSPQSHATPWSYPVLAPLSRCYPGPKGRLLTCYSPVRRCTRSPKGTFSLDLHVLGTPPAFVLSQDQTLQFELRVCFQTDLAGPSELYCSKEPVGLRCTLFRCQRTIRQIDFRNLIFWKDSLPLSTVFRPRRIFSPPGPSKKITPAPRPCHSISNKFHEFERFVEDWKAIVFAPLSQNQKSEKMTLSQSQKSIQGSLLLLSVYIFGQNPRESAFPDLDHAGRVQFQP